MQTNDIKNSIINKIKFLKNGNTNEKLLADEMENKIKNINCFYCLDTKHIWGYRSADHVFWSRFAGNNNNFWVGNCGKCNNHKFLYDINNNEIIIDGKYKLFNVDDTDSISRINELIRVCERDVKERLQIPIEKPIIKDVPKEEADIEVERDVIIQKITKRTLSTDVKKISEALAVIFYQIIFEKSFFDILP